jgi:metal-responsive CopG/Arc/MetJ family transcriptional regulator
LREVCKPRKINRPREAAISVFSLTIPNEFLPALDELVTQSGAGSRDLWLRNVVGTLLIQHQVDKEVGPQAQQRTAELGAIWTQSAG